MKHFERLMMVSSDAEKKMHYYKDLALKELDSFPESPSKDAFIGLINYSIYRKK